MTLGGELPRLAPPGAASADDLRTLAEIAYELGADEIAADTAALAERVTEGRVFVACLGQFKRGKSTLLNALLGEAVLPAGVVPVTAAVTIVRYGELPRVVVHRRAGSPIEVEISQLANYVTEANNPQNVKAVELVEVFHPSPLLRTGVCLIDTPGVGSSSPLASSVTRHFVPQIDAALFVVGADPPISGEEIALLQDVNQETSRLVFAINKADKLGDAEMAEVLVFTERVLADRLGVVPDALFLVSAKERLERGVATRDWARLERALATLTSEGRHAALLARVRSTSRRSAVQLIQRIDTVVAALRAPVETTRQRLDSLRGWTAQAERALTDFGVLLNAEQRAIAGVVAAETSTAQTRLRAAALVELQRALTEAARQGRPSWHAAFAIAQDIARRAVHSELTALEGRTAGAYEDGTRRFVMLANDLLTRLAAEEPDLQRLPPIECQVELSGQRKFFFTELMTLTANSPWQFLRDHLGSPTHQRQRITDRASAYLTRLLETNTSRVVHDLDERLRESREALDREIRLRLTELVAASQRSAARAAEIREHGEAALAREVQRLGVIRNRLQDLRFEHRPSVERPS